MDDAARPVQAGDRVTEKPFEPEAAIDALAPLLGFALTEESRAEVARQLRVAAAQAELLLSASFDDEDEPAPVFRA